MPNDVSWDCFGEVLREVGGLEMTPMAIAVMQFTGLKDKAGKEIYEGDILKNEYHSCVFNIGWDENLGSFIGRYNKFGKAALCAINDESVVIGNIYENPELLKA